MGRWICHGSPTAGAVLFLEVCGPFLFNVTEALAYIKANWQGCLQHTS